MKRNVRNQSPEFRQKHQSLELLSMKLSLIIQHQDIRMWVPSILSSIWLKDQHPEV